MNHISIDSVCQESSDVDRQIVTGEHPTAIGGFTATTYKNSARPEKSNKEFI